MRLQWSGDTSFHTISRSEGAKLPQQLRPSGNLEELTKASAQPLDDVWASQFQWPESSNEEPVPLESVVADSARPSSVYGFVQSEDGEWA